MANTFPDEAPYELKNSELHHDLKRHKDDKAKAEDKNENDKRDD